MSSRAYQLLRVTYWRLPLSQSLKERIASYLRRLMRGRTNQTVVADDQRELVLLRDYAAQVLAIPGRSGSDFVPLREDRSKSGRTTRRSSPTICRSSIRPRRTIAGGVAA